MALYKPIGKPYSLYSIDVIPATPVTGTSALTAKQYTPKEDRKHPILIAKICNTFFFITN